MGRIESNHLVSVLDLSKMREKVMELVNKHDPQPTSRIINTAMGWGVVQKDGKHYLINTEGVGSSVPMEDEEEEIDWYIDEVDEAGAVIKVGMFPISRSTFYYFELLENSTFVGDVPLHFFVRYFSNRLDNNVQKWDWFLSSVSVKKGK